MITNFNFSLYLRASKKNKQGESAIYMRIVDNLGNIHRKSTSLYVLKEEWDKTNQIAKTSLNRNYQLNIELDKLKLKIEERRRSMEINKYDFRKDQFLSFLIGETKIEYPTFLDFFAKRIDELKKLNYSSGTIISYNSSYSRLFECFEKLKWNRNLLLKEFNLSKVLDFETFYKHGCSNEPNTLAKHHKNIKAVLNYALKKELITSNPYKNHKVKWVQKERPSLTKQELEKIENKIFSIERVETVKNLFLFSCYTGMAYSDLMSLKVTEVLLDETSNLYLDFKRDKTGNRCIVPLVDKAIQIIKPFLAGKDQNDRVFNSISNQKLNSYLKEIADMSDIKINLTHHVARHTFATTICNEGDIDIYAQKDMLGHSKVTTTMIYSKNRKKHLIGFRDKLNARVGIR